MARFSLHTVGRDRPGIIAGVTGALADLGANLEESNMTILHGQSAIMLVLDIPNIDDGRLVERALERVAEQLNLFVTVCPMPEAPTAVLGEECFLVAVEGTDQSGIVAGVTGALAKLGANVIDLTSHPVVRDDAVGYVMKLSVVLPSGMNLTTLEDAMNDASETLRISYSVQPWSGELMWDAP